MFFDESNEKLLFVIPAPSTSSWLVVMEPHINISHLNPTKTLEE